MSRFLKILEAKFTGQQRADRFDFGSIECVVEPADIEPTRAVRTQQEYVFRFQWFNRFFCDQRNFIEAKKNVVRQLENDLYGNVHRWILAAREAVFEGDREKLMALLDKLEDGIE